MREADGIPKFAGMARNGCRSRGAGVYGLPIPPAAPAGWGAPGGTPPGARLRYYLRNTLACKGNPLLM